MLTPYSLISDLVLKNALQSRRIVQMALAEYLNTKTFVLPLKKNLSSILQSLATEKSEIFEITEAQDKDYQQHKYLCHDRFHISGETTEKGKNLINLNDNEVTIEEANFILLLRLIVELKNNKEGLVDQHTLHKEGIISDPERFQHFSRLRKELETNLIGKNGIEFIQNIPKKGYRISTHPDFVTYDKDKLLKLENYRIVEIAERLP